MGLRSRVTFLWQQALVSFGGQENMESAGKAATRQAMQQGRRKLTCAAKVDGEVVRWQLWSWCHSAASPSRTDWSVSGLGSLLHIRFKTQHVTSATADRLSQAKSSRSKSQRQFQETGRRMFQAETAGATGALRSRTRHRDKRRLGAAGQGLCPSTCDAGLRR